MGHRWTIAVAGLVGLASSAVAAHGADAPRRAETHIAGVAVVPSPFGDALPVTVAIQSGDDMPWPAGFGPPASNHDRGLVEMCTPGNCVQTAAFVASPSPFPVVGLDCTIVVPADESATGRTTWHGASNRSSAYDMDSWHLYRVEDGTHGEPDRVGMRLDAHHVDVHDGSCGAAAVPTTPVLAGDFVVGRPHVRITARRP
jgi:hypothetical protein